MLDSTGRESVAHVAQRMRCMGGITESMNISLSNSWEIVKERDAWYTAVYGVTKSWR